jgi:hypothetical protein
MKRTTLYVLAVTPVAAIGGLIFGFDTAVVAGATRYMKDSTAFWLYAAMCALDLAFMIAFLPETKGRSLEEIERHWLKTTAS